MKRNWVNRRETEWISGWPEWAERDEQESLGQNQGEWHARAVIPFHSQQKWHSPPSSKCHLLSHLCHKSQFPLWMGRVWPWRSVGHRAHCPFPPCHIENCKTLPTPSHQASNSSGKFFKNLELQSLVGPNRGQDLFAKFPDKMLLYSQAWDPRPSSHST